MQNNPKYLGDDCLVVDNDLLRTLLLFSDDLCLIHPYFPFRSIVMNIEIHLKQLKGGHLRWLRHEDVHSVTNSQ